MYSVLPAIVSVLFLGYGLYALASRGLNRTSASFFLLCLTMFFWQGTWAVLFQVSDPAIADILVKFGYLFILFLPSSLYHFLAEICGRREELRYVYLSYALALALAVMLLLSDLFVAGHYRYFWGYYPKAGALHPVHLLQTLVIMLRCLHLTYVAQKSASSDKQTRLRLCFAGTLIATFSAIDYLCNYGFEFYPPGVFFTAVTLGFYMIAIVKYDLLNPMALAGTIAHEIRTPLATIRNQAIGISTYLPTLLEGYRRAVEHGLMKPGIQTQHLALLSGMSRVITQEVDKSNAVIDMMLASTSMEHPEAMPFERHKIGICVAEALARYPFEPGMKEKVAVSIESDFEFYGSDALLVSVLFNLIKNGLHALQASGKGEIRISTKAARERNTLLLTDTGLGIPPNILPHIFEPFYSTKHKGGGAGIGLPFCQKVMSAFDGDIRCDSIEGEYTTFALEFPAI